jgi:hypothetical protein
MSMNLPDTARRVMLCLRKDGCSAEAEAISAGTQDGIILTARTCALAIRC